ncbi:MAG TPA: hypothetical protein VD835_00820 [Pyrinomonadaceae bacterium]|nr:hypothetical protein [Pyrinomonadaceae bacterium]
MLKLLSTEQSTWNKIRSIFEILVYTANFVAALVASALAIFWEFKSELDVKGYLQAILVIVAFFSLTFLYERFGILRKLLTGNQTLKDDTDYIRNTVAGLHRVKEDVDHIKDTVVGLQGIKRLKDNLHELEDMLEKWRGTLNNNEGRVLQETWIKLIGLYVKQEANGLGKRSITATSEIYTQLFSKLTEYLYEDVRDMKDTALCRLHITGMLPEEFFNGPQIEYTTLNRSPIIFCHAYEDDKYGESHYKFIEDMEKYKDLLEVKRCIVVRDRNAPDEFSALSTSDDLKEQFELSIHQGGKRPVLRSQHNETDLEKYLERLFIHCDDKVRQYKDDTGKTEKSFLTKIVHSEDYSYYPIAKTSSIDKASGNYNDLIAHFKKAFGKDIYYFCATEKDGSNHQLKRYFRIGGWPEIVLFGFISKDAQTASAKKWTELVNWKVGIESHYRPLTRQMDIKLLDVGEAKTLVSIFSPWLREAKQLKELILLQEKDLLDVPGLMNTLKGGEDPVSVYLRQQFAPATMQLLKAYVHPNHPDKELLKAVINDFNGLLQGASLYEVKCFKEIQLLEETRELLEQNPQEEDLIRLNRMLLEDAYPGKIAKNLIK